MRTKITCCHNCTERVIGCHSSCTRYKTQRAAWKREKEQIKQAKEKSRPDNFDRLSYWRK